MAYLIGYSRYNFDQYALVLRLLAHLCGPRIWCLFTGPHCQFVQYSIPCGTNEHDEIGLCMDLWLWLVPFSAKRKRWRYNLLGKINDCFEWALFHRQGLFHGSHLKFDEPSLDSYHKEPTMFCILPHGTLPTRVLDVWHKFDHFFDEVCCFFGSQVALVHGNCYTLAMRGEFMPANKPELIRVMRTNQSVSLLPGVISEMMNCDSHSPQINVSIKHKGFIKLALQHGYDLVPTFFFHATKPYDLLRLYLLPLLNGLLLFFKPVRYEYCVDRISLLSSVTYGSPLFRGVKPSLSPNLFLILLMLLLIMYLFASITDLLARQNSLSDSTALDPTSICLSNWTVLPPWPCWLHFFQSGMREIEFVWDRL